MRMKCNAEQGGWLGRGSRGFLDKPLGNVASRLQRSEASGIIHVLLHKSWEFKEQAL